MVFLIGGSSVLLRTHFKIESPIKFWSKSSSFATRCSSLEPPNVAHLAETSRITLSQKEIEDFAPKINKVIGWFGQLQGVDLESVEPSLRADTDASTKPREDVPEAFENREAILAEIPCFSESYIKVPKVLTKE